MIRPRRGKPQASLLVTSTIGEANNHMLLQAFLNA